MFCLDLSPSLAALASQQCDGTVQSQATSAVLDFRPAVHSCASPLSLLHSELLAEIVFGAVIQLLSECLKHSEDQLFQRVREVGEKLQHLFERF